MSTKRIPDPFRLEKVLVIYDHQNEWSKTVVLGSPLAYFTKFVIILVIFIKFFDKIDENDLKTSFLSNLVA